ncbi:hypothetical protein GSI_03665 [Ganoderma sinense ZZ0214-1]|uniref:Uncharacterized protein n=1 Tax=Ganoderma sinense ZZ0214-1 TaxID=1077348 RepID=A0A2G8SJQ3_9APHY|nr:hypothetical protein GSI_03665 [Ganoderma sinense ZZ0214-1]
MPPSRVQRSPKIAVLSAIPPHVTGKSRRRRRKTVGCYTKPGPSPLRRSFTAEDLLRQAAKAAREPRYSNPYNSQNCCYHYLFPPGSPYESWNPRLSVDFWTRVHHDRAENRFFKYHYLFPPAEVNAKVVCSKRIWVVNRLRTRFGTNAIAIISVDEYST